MGMLGLYQNYKLCQKCKNRTPNGCSIPGLIPNKRMGSDCFYVDIDLPDKLLGIKRIPLNTNDMTMDIKK